MNARLAVVVLAVTASQAPANAMCQRPAGADTMSGAAVAESLKVLKGLRAQLDKDKNNAALWYRRGMLAWMLYDRDRTRGGLKELDWTLLGREADSSIRLASSIEPKNARYELTKGQYYLGSGWILMRLQSYHVFDLAIQKAKASGDVRLIAEAAVEKGRVHWRRYDPGSFGGTPSWMGDASEASPPDSGQAARMLAREMEIPGAREAINRESLRAARALLAEQFAPKDRHFLRESDYLRAEEFFREAYAADPTYRRAYSQLAMLYGERMRWRELAHLAREQLRRTPQDGWVWMTLGLALHRHEAHAPAAAAFDTALRLLPAVERARLDNFERLLRPSDSTRFRNLPDSVRRATERFYWLSADPLWSQDSGEPRIEFLARVTYAELRWTVEELRKRGADSDRGAVFIRYGPPDARGGREWWTYDYARMTFRFNGMPTFGTAYFSNPYWAEIMLDSIPARWDNIVRGRIDSMLVQVSRFRATPDSVDVVFASSPPVDIIRARSDVDEPVRSDFWLIGAGIGMVHDSTSPKSPDVRHFAHRLPLGPYIYRFEASSAASTVAARAMSTLTVGEDTTSGFATRGFGISDVLVTGNAIPRGGTRRWTGFTIAPIVGTVRRGSEFALLWENYDFGMAADSASRYEVSISLHGERTPLQSIRAQIINAMRATLFGDFVGDRIIFKYERVVPHADAFADYITLNLGETPVGNYWLTLEILDRVSGRKTSRTMRVTVRE